MAAKVFYADAYANPLPRLFEFAVGMLLAELYQKPRRIDRVGTKADMVMFLAAWFTLIWGITELSRHHIGSYVNYQLFTIPLFPIIIVYSCRMKQPRRGQKVVQYLSGLALCFYLVQYPWPITDALLAQYPDITSPLLFTFVSGFVATCIMTLMLYYCVQNPVKKTAYRILHL